MATIETLRAGDRIADKYIVERVLGQGGMGMVVAARHVDLDQMVAIKFILPDALRQPGIVDRLLREARASARLRSEHVAKVIDVGRTPDGAPYLVMELLEGRDLALMLEEHTMIPAAEAALYVGQACEAIAEAHAAGIIHRDIKPANLFLVARRDGSPCVKVLDFGIAKEDSLANAAMTSTGSVLGTPVYMSPEQVRSAKTATPATDIWALGITLYELTTGQIPYDVTTVTELIAKILTEPPIPARLRNPSLPPEMEAVIMRCLEVDPARRYASASALRDALDALADARGTPLSSFMHPASAAVPSSSDSPTRVREAPLVAASHTSLQDRPVAAHTQASPGVTPSPGRLASRTESGTSHAVSPPRGSSRRAVAAAAILAVGALAGGGAYWATREPVVPASVSAEADRASVPSAGPDVAPGSSAASPPPSGPDPATSGSSSTAPAPTSAGSVASASASASAAPDAPPPKPAPPGGKRAPAAKPPDPPPSPPTPTTAQPGWGHML